MGKVNSTLFGSLYRQSKKKQLANVPQMSIPLDAIEVNVFHKFIERTKIRQGRLKQFGDKVKIISADNTKHHKGTLSSQDYE